MALLSSMLFSSLLSEISFLCMRSLILLTRFLFSPNPSSVAHYSDAGIVALLVLCGAMVIGSFVLSRWRKRLKNAVTRKLSASWSSFMMWMGVVGLILIVARVERIQFVALPFLWVIWGLIVIIYVVLQWRLFFMRHYEVMPRNVAIDPREEYLPKRKK